MIDLSRRGEHLNMAKKNMGNDELRPAMFSGEKFLAFDGMNQEQDEAAISTDRIEDVLQKLDGSAFAETDDGILIEEVASSVVADEDDTSLDEEDELDLSAGEDDKASDPVRMYLRQMGVVPLLTRDQEVTIAQRIERGQNKTQKAISRSPIAITALLKVGDELETGALSIRDIVIFSDQTEFAEQE